MCDHPLSKLKDESAEVQGQTVTVRFACTGCFATITKQFRHSTSETVAVRIEEPYLLVNRY
jgi:hypothetical protein